MLIDDAQAIAAHFEDDPTVYAVNLAGGFWGVEAQTDSLDEYGDIYYLQVGSDDDGNVLIQPLTLRRGPVTDDHIVPGLEESDHGAIAEAVERYRVMDIDSLLALTEPW